MLLAVDVGNTMTCAGIYDTDSVVKKNNSENYKKSAKMVDSWSFATNKNAAIDEISHLIERVKDVDAIALSCVVPEITHVWKSAAEKNNIPCFILKSNHYPKIAYPYPEEIGSDGIAAIIGANEICKPPFVVVDFGTATNMCVVDGDGVFLGGVICAGVATSMHALVGAASKLGGIEIASPAHVVGGSTEEAIQSGIVVGEAARADGLLDRIEEEMGEPIKVITTGGWSKLVSQHMRREHKLAPNLLLDGLLAAYLKGAFK